MVCSSVCEGKSFKRTWGHSNHISPTPQNILLLIPVAQCSRLCLELLPLMPLPTWRGSNGKPLTCLPQESLMSFWNLTGQTQLACLTPDWTGQMGEAMGTLGYIKVNK